MKSMIVTFYYGLFKLIILPRRVSVPLFVSEPPLLMVRFPLMSNVIEAGNVTVAFALMVRLLQDIPVTLTFG